MGGTGTHKNERNPCKLPESRVVFLKLRHLRKSTAKNNQNSELHSGNHKLQAALRQWWLTGDLLSVKAQGERVVQDIE